MELLVTFGYGAKIDGRSCDWAWVSSFTTRMLFHPSSEAVPSRIRQQKERDGQSLSSDVPKINNVFNPHCPKDIRIWKPLPFCA